MPTGFEAWSAQVPAEIRADVLWHLTTYRLALFAGDMADRDADRCSADPSSNHIADQLRRAVHSISVNIAEGYGRTGSRDRARFFEFALGSARESREWYFKARGCLGPERSAEALAVTTRIIQMLIAFIRKEKSRAP